MLIDSQNDRAIHSHDIRCSHCFKTGVPSLFVPGNTSGILTQCGVYSHKMATTRGGTNHKMDAAAYFIREEPCIELAAAA